MKIHRNRAIHLPVILIAVTGLLSPGAALPAASGGDPPPPELGSLGDDLFLLRTSVAPNVVLFFDNSKSMNSIEWHEDFDPDADPLDYGCADFDNDLVYSTDDLDDSIAHCGHTRTIFEPETPTLWDGRYLNWYYGLADGSSTLDEIENAKAEIAGCNKAGGSSSFDDKYRRTRTQASKQVLLDLLCVAEPKGLRFALAEFRLPDNLDAPLLGDDPNGGFVSVEIDRANPSHAAELEAALKNTDSLSDTPLGETLFQLYTYYMSRDDADLPTNEVTGATFPRYEYDKFGNLEANDNKWTDDPIEYACQKSFIVLVSDGVPSRDDFDSDPADTAQGFDEFDDLIGDYAADGEDEVPGDPDESAWYLDDIAKYMAEKDFRPDLAEDQTIDTYTIGFSTSDAADDLLERAAQLGNGLFFHAQTGDDLAAALVAALNDIIEKAQSFTAASVPSARTADGGDFYQSYFFPVGSTAFWEGHMRAWKITADGSIIDKNGVCALEDPTAGECNSGPFKPEAEFYWDAADGVPLPAARTLYVSTSAATHSSEPPLFDDSLTATDLAIDPFAAAPDPAPNSAQYPIKGSTALDAEGLADEVVWAGRGCFFGTGVTDASLVATPAACAERPSRLGDVFHSNPVVVRQPIRFGGDPSYNSFKTAYEERSRVIYAGTNGGFLEALDAGAWNSSLLKYEPGSGGELFGFMPWQARQNIKNLPIDFATSRTHYVDGDPQTSDVWFYDDSNEYDLSHEASEWRTVLVGGLRKGGRHYYALDVTNPDGIAGPGGATLEYPGYLWEFPDEDDTQNEAAFMGETWGRPILTKIRVAVNGNTNGGLGYERWVAIVSAGYDATSDPNPESLTTLTSEYAGGATAGRAIYVVDVKTGEVIASKKFDSGAADAQADMLYTLVGTPGVFDLNFDGYADVIYAGDMGGNLFKWVIGNGVDPSAWPFKLFFQAPVETISGDSFYKNMFFPPAATYSGGHLWLAFGTGERRSLAFLGESGEDENNRFYVVQDPDPRELLVTPLSTITESDLTDISSDEDGASFTGYGYYFKVADGEKFVTNVEIFAGHVIAASFLPDTSGAVCTGRGEGKLYAFDIVDGKGYFEDASSNPVRSIGIGTGLPTDPKISVGVGGTENRVYIEKSGADLESIEEEDVDAGGRLLYWREQP